jgi:hypothetical protein
MLHIRTSYLSVSKPNRSHRIRDDTNVNGKIFRSISTWQKLYIITIKDFGKQHLDLVACEKPTRTGVAADTPMELIRPGSDELRLYQSRASSSFGHTYLVFVVVPWQGSQLLETKAVKVLGVLEELLVKCGRTSCHTNVRALRKSYTIG